MRVPSPKGSLPHPPATTHYRHIGRSYLTTGQPPRQSASQADASNGCLRRCSATVGIMCPAPRDLPPHRQPPCPPATPGTSCLFSHPACLADLRRTSRHDPCGIPRPAGDGPNSALRVRLSWMRAPRARAAAGRVAPQAEPFRSPTAIPLDPRPCGRRQWHVSVLREAKPMPGIGSRSFGVFQDASGWSVGSRLGRPGAKAIRHGHERGLLDRGVPAHNPSHPPPLASAARQRLTPRRPAEGPTLELTMSGEHFRQRGLSRRHPGPVALSFSAVGQPDRRSCGLVRWAHPVALRPGRTQAACPPRP